MQQLLTRLQHHSLESCVLPHALVCLQGGAGVDARAEEAVYDWGRALRLYSQRGLCAVQGELLVLVAYPQQEIASNQCVKGPFRHVW